MFALWSQGISQQQIPKRQGGSREKKRKREKEKRKVKSCSSSFQCLPQLQLQSLVRSQIPALISFEIVNGALASHCRDSQGVLLMTHLLGHAEQMPNLTIRIKACSFGSAVFTITCLWEEWRSWCELALLFHTFVSYAATTEPITSKYPAGYSVKHLQQYCATFVSKAATISNLLPDLLHILLI